MQERRKKFGEAVRAAREAAGYTGRPAFAEVVGIGSRTLAAVELAEEGSGGRKARAAIARTLGWDPSEVESYIAGQSNTLPAADITASPRDSRETWMRRILDRAEEIEKEAGRAAADAYVTGAIQRWRDEHRTNDADEQQARDVS